KGDVNRYIKTFEKQFDTKGFVLQTGLNYIAFSLDQRFRKDQNKPRRQYLEVGYSFNLKIIFSPLLKEEEIKKFLGALWCAFYLGNFGSRARRGFGSIAVKHFVVKSTEDKEISSNFKLPFSFKPEGEMESWLKENYKKIMELFSKSIDIEIYIFKKTDANTIQSWANEVQKGREGRYLAKEYKTLSTSPSPFNKLANQNAWRELLNFMGFTLMAYRSYLKPDYEVAKKIIQGQIQGNITIKRVIFGLPLNFHFSSLKESRRQSGMVFPVKKDEKLRRASPLIYKILKNGDRLDGLIIFIKGTFLPEDVELKLESVKIQKPDCSLIEDYLKSLLNRGIIRRLI
ncbi:MAG: hypothetical protein ACK4UR_04945, partial [Caldimicrobium sp.]